MTLYPNSGEAVIWREPPVAPADPSHAVEEAAGGTRRVRSPLDAGEDGAASVDQERTVRRARGRVRRYAVANGCTRLATFTYGGRDRPTERRRVKDDWARFAREAKRRWPELAWVRVLERHKDGRLHVHAAISRYVRKDELAKLWGHGFVDVRKIRSRRGGREDARAAARYVAKYATKFRETDPGEHGYEVAQGHQPVVERLRSWDRTEGLRDAIRAMGGEVPAYEWDSGSSEDWTGPPVAFVGW